MNGRLKSDQRRGFAGGLAVGVAATAVLAGGVAAAAIPSTSTGLITGCRTVTTGVLRVIDYQAGKRCTTKERTLTWNVRGPQGLRGLTGAIGAKGAIGSTGPAGIVGPTGTTGLAGTPGLPGTPGLTGATGVDGPVGPVGTTGATGVDGPAGPVGTTGATGVDGPAGPLGTTGATGATGATGPAGPAGALKYIGQERSTSDIPPSGLKDLMVTCPAGTVPMGGGWDTYITGGPYDGSATKNMVTVTREMYVAQAFLVTVVNNLALYTVRLTSYVSCWQGSYQ